MAVHLPLEADYSSIFGQKLLCESVQLHASQFWQRNTLDSIVQRAQAIMQVQSGQFELTQHEKHPQKRRLLREKQQQAPDRPQDQSESAVAGRILQGELQDVRANCERIENIPDPCHLRKDRLGPPLIFGSPSVESIHRSHLLHVSAEQKAERSETFRVPRVAPVNGYGESERKDYESKQEVRPSFASSFVYLESN